MSTQLFRVKEAAQALNVSVGKIRADVLHRRIAYVKLPGGAVRIPATAIEQIISSGTIPAKEGAR